MSDETPEATPRRLTPKQARFVAEYLVDLNATQAAIRAGYAAGSAGRNADALMKNHEIQKAVSEGKAAQLEAIGVNAHRVLSELASLGFSDVGELFSDDGKLKPLKEIRREMRAAIASVKVTKKNLVAGDGVLDDVVEVRLWEKTRALESLAKHLGLLTEKLKVDGDFVLRWQDSESA